MSNETVTTAQTGAALAGPPPPEIRRAGGVRLRAERAVVRSLAARVEGLTITDRSGSAPSGPPMHASATSSPGGPYEIVVLDPRAYAAAARSGSAGLGEAWFRGWWYTDDLVGLLRMLIGAMRPLDRRRDRLHALLRPVLDPIRKMRRPNPDRDRRNVRAHYDLGNEFFEAFLDETMTYSCAVFESPSVTLAEASTEKLDRLCRKVGLRGDHQVVEIGTGWGSFALHAAGRYGSHVTTTTVSAAQARLARERFVSAGLADRIDLRELDYRRLTGTYDRLISIEMIEAVDWRDVPGYLQTCARLLRPDGVMGLQAIVMADQRWARTRVTEDFIKRWVFPGGSLPSLTSISDAVTKCTDLRITDIEDLGLHYAETLHRWRERLHARWGDLAELGVTEELGRLWDFYLAYCEAAFLERHVSVAQIVLAKPRWRPDALAVRQR